VGDGAVIATGGYDQTIRIWDTRIASGTKGSNPVTFKMPAPVESVIALNNTTLVGSAGHQLAVIDLVANRPLGLWANNHQKTITSIAVASNGTRVLTGALDGHVKVWDTESWKVVAGLKYPSPILSLDVTASGPKKEDKHLCVGMQSGVLSIKTRTTGAAKAAKREKEREMAALLAGTIDEYDAKKGKKIGSGAARAKRGLDFAGEGADIIIDGQAGKKAKKLNAWESLARQGDWNASLTEVLKSQNQTAIFTMLTHMQHRSSLRKALSQRNAKNILPVMNWLIKRIKDPKYMRLKADVAMLIIDMYGAEFGKSEEFDKVFERLLRETKEACETSQMCVTAKGMFGLLEMDAVGVAVG
jgi:U3 small nucleolar RNA-associated protein 15